MASVGHKLVAISVLYSKHKCQINIDLNTFEHDFINVFSIIIVKYIQKAFYVTEILLKGLLKELI